MSSSNTFDLESQTINGVSCPAPAYTAPSSRTTNPVDDFFGYTFTRDSRRVSVTSEALPPYAETLPSYATSQKSEPVTLARYLFKFGFLFPLFWILGAIILISPLSAPDSSDAVLSWLPEKTDAERQQIIKDVRKTELKWAKRCLLALIALIFLAAAIATTAWAVIHSH
ncbi:hypothetical protein BDN72DRAFT_886129 [Pluteus cervinus]|uniref:Uncharacterized protein n=1 Tax=Pluteus cervinus TaxID=181527 RepID=A0ACD3BBF2_9AGAR|nr:hypothetical protein BDN72DRAFT_886129 [Pluteus cervinus]